MVSHGNYKTYYRSILWNYWLLYWTGFSWLQFILISNLLLVIHSLVLQTILCIYFNLNTLYTHTPTHTHIYIYMYSSRKSISRIEIFRWNIYSKFSTISEAGVSELLINLEDIWRNSPTSNCATAMEIVEGILKTVLFHGNMHGCRC